MHNVTAKQMSERPKKHWTDTGR